MTKARAIAISKTLADSAAEETRGVIVCACALALVLAGSWQPF